MQVQYCQHRFICKFYFHSSGVLKIELKHWCYQSTFNVLLSWLFEMARTQYLSLTCDFSSQVLYLPRSCHRYAIFNISNMVGKTNVCQIQLGHDIHFKEPTKKTLSVQKVMKNLLKIKVPKILLPQKSFYPIVH